MISTKMTPDEKLSIRLAMADWTLARERDLVPPEYPERPPELPSSNEELSLILGAAWRMGERANPGDRAISAVFGDWRYLVWLSESEATSRLEILFECARTYTEARDAYPADAVFREKLAKLTEFTRRAWDLDVVPVPSRAEAKKIATATAVRDDVLPGWLAAGARPPRDVPRVEAPRHFTEAADDDLPYG